MSRLQPANLQVVTGAFGYTGRHIASLLLERGYRVRTLTGHPERAGLFGGRVETAPLDFERLDELKRHLAGAETLHNTYWVRFERGEKTFAQAVRNTEILLHAAAAAGVRRVVHISVSNPAEDSPLPYFRGKALVERSLVESGLSYAIVRPTVMFGTGDILINNIAWMLRRLPVFGVFGSGQYRLQPVYVGDVAALAVELADRADDAIADAAGPETYTFDELVRLIRLELGSRALIAHLPPALARAAAGVVGWLVRDVVITRDETAGLMANLLVSAQPPLCPTRFSQWLTEHVSEAGATYASELKRHFTRPSATGPQ